MTKRAEMGEGGFVIKANSQGIGRVKSSPNGAVM